MTEPQKTTGDNVPDIMLEHRLSGTTTHEAGDAMPDDGTAPEIGDTMPDGTIYAGISPDTDKPMYVTPKDAPTLLRWKRARQYAANLDAYGHHDWEIPTKGELSILFLNRAAIGNFNETDSDHNSLYWSSTQVPGFFMWSRWFKNGNSDWSIKIWHCPLRCVRS